MQSANAEESPAAHTMESRKKNVPQDGKRTSKGVWLGLCAILALYVWSAWQFGPVSNFGKVLDDGLYFSAAKALAAGQGYVLPSFPVRLAATKYPEFYPLLLAGIWKLDPSFPSNVNLAVAMTLAFGCAALIFMFLLIRRWPGLGDWDTLGVVALCAFSGYFLDLSASVMTDIPFMALMLGAIWLAEISVQVSTSHPGKRGFQTRPYKLQIAAPSASDWAVLGAGALAGLAIGFRTLGAAVVAGIGIVLLVRREWRKLIWFSIAAAPISLLMVWPQLLAMFHPRAMPAAAGVGSSGWSRTLCYYTSYACGWRLDTSGPGALRAIALTNLRGLFEAPGITLLSPLGAGQQVWALGLVMLLSVVAYVGVLRYVRRAGWQPLPVVFLLYLLVIIPWPYTPDRFLVPFLPLLLGGFWLEGRHMAKLIAANLRPPHGMGDRVAAGVMAAGGLAIAAILVMNYVYAIPQKVTNFATANRRMMTDKRAAYQWIREHAEPGARVIAYEDGLSYLFTDHPSVMPIDCRTQAFYLQDKRYAEQDAAQMADVARHIGASYWIATANDFLLDGDPDHKILTRKQEELLKGSPEVFRSSDGMVRVYDVRRMTIADANGRGASPRGK